VGRNLHRSLRDSGRLQIFPSPLGHNYGPQEFLNRYASVLCFRRYYCERLFPHAKHELGHGQGTSRRVSSVSSHRGTYITFYTPAKVSQKTLNKNFPSRERVYRLTLSPTKYKTRKATSIPGSPVNPEGMVYNRIAMEPHELV